MKLNILLVDDEPKVLRGLRAIIERSGEEWNIVGECRNGAEALEFMSENCPDVVITDIKMPCMSGLELVEKAKALSQDLKFIILSGYPDFKYAQQAIRLETVDYILKPPDYRDILKSIKKVEEQKIENEKKLKEEEELKDFKKSSMQIIKDKIFNEMLYKPKFSTAHHDRLKANEYSMFLERFALFIIRIDSFSFSIFDLTDDSQRRLEKFRECLQEVIYKRGGCIADFFDGTYCCFMNVDNESPVYLRGFAKDLQNELQRVCKDSVTIGISRAYKGPHMVNRAFNECLYILRNKVFHERSSIIYIDEVKMDKSAEGYPFELERRYIELLRYGDREKSIETLHKIIKRIVSISGHDPVVFKSRILEFLIAVSRELNEGGLSPHIQPDMVQDGRILNKLNSIDNIDDMEVLLNEYTQSMVGYFEMKNKPSCRRIINEIKNYIHNNYFNDISLRGIARQFFMNESYLSDLFKRETGISFISYLTKERVEKAKALLNQPDLKIYDISEMVGYKNPRYFNNVFKKHTGMTPFEYRERIGDYEK